MMKGKATPLISSFKLSYYTLLNLLRRIEGSGAHLDSNQLALPGLDLTWLGLTFKAGSAQARL